MPVKRGGWLLPSLLFVAVTGFLGVASKLAREELSWQELLVWTAVVYALVALLVGFARPRLQGGRGAGWGIASGACAALALVMLFVALGAGEVGQVVPVTASYPVFTLLLAAVVLAERVTPARVGATMLVVVGVILLSMD